jgi:hypothetical protein
MQFDPTFRTGLLPAKCSGFSGIGFFLKYLFFFCFVFLLLGRVRLMNGTLRVDTVTGIGTLAANGADALNRVVNHRRRLLNIHLAPPISTFCDPPMAPNETRILKKSLGNRSHIESSGC